MMDEATANKWFIVETKEYILQTGGTLTLKEFHKALQACEDLGLSETWRFFKGRLEQLQRQRFAELKTEKSLARKEQEQCQTG